MQPKAAGVHTRLLLHVACQEVLCPHSPMLCLELSDPTRFSLGGGSHCCLSKDGCLTCIR